MAPPARQMQIILFNVLNIAGTSWVAPTAPMRTVRRKELNIFAQNQDSAHIPITERTKRQRRRLRAAPTVLNQWISSLCNHQGQLQVWIDLDNSADSIEQLENAQV